MYSDYNIIPIGDHCAISMLLKELKLRKQSYPFDWVSTPNQPIDTNIIYNLKIISQLKMLDNVDDIIKTYIGDAFDNDKKINSINNIWFPHDSTNKTETFEKYKRRFIRLKEDLSKKNIFILLTRHYYIEKQVFEQISEQLLGYNSDSIILFISGTDHTYFDNIKYPNIIFKHIEYDISKFYNYDYTSFRPNIKIFLSNFLKSSIM